MRLRRSVSRSSGTSTWKGRMSVAVWTVLVITHLRRGTCARDYACGERQATKMSGRRVLVRAAHEDRSTQRLECGAHLAGEELGLFPGGEGPAPVRLVEVGEVVVRVLDPVARRLEELVREHRVSDRELDVRRRILERRLCAPPVLPVQPRGRGACTRQPVQRDVVEDVVAG